MMIIVVNGPMHLSRSEGNLVIRRRHSEMSVPMADVEFEVEMPILAPRTAARPVSSGNSCFSCGGMTVRTGTCETCTSCGTSGGCG